MPPKAKKLLEGSNERTDTFYGAQLSRSKDVLEWPYKTPSPEFMGKSGFYFTPTKKLTDRVTCYYCKTTQCNWRDVKDPTSYHLEHNKECSFSKLLHLSKERSTNPEFDWSKVEQFKEPLSEEAIEIRQETFGKKWPHDKVTGSNATSKNMVNAGFYYSPMDTGDDLAICVYCGVSLEGWEYDDDPLFEHQKRSKGCYFLEQLESKKSIKRSSAIAVIEEEEEQEEEKTSIEAPYGSDITGSNGRSLRPKRKRKMFKELSSDDSIIDDEKDKSFGITANEEELSDEPYAEESENKPSNSATVNKKGLQAKRSTSPQKKSKILDSSFEHDMFSTNKSQNLELPPLSKMPSISPERKNKNESLNNVPKDANNENKSVQGKTKDHSQSPVRTSLKSALADITNISKKQSNSPRKRSEVMESEESEEENSIILINNSKDNISRDSTEKEESMKSAREEQSFEPKNENPVKEALAEQSPNIREEQDNVIQKKPFPDLTRSFSNEHSKQIHDSTIHEIEKSKDQDSNIKSSQTEAKSDSKTILQSISRLFKSPQLQRSRSPFLDNTFQDASDQIIEEKEPVVLANDTPIEESTDHQIELGRETKDESIQQSSAQKDVKDEDSILKDLEKSQRYESSEDENEDSEADYQSIEDEPSNYWTPTDTNLLFKKLEPLETAKNYIREIKDLEYELNNDIDGRISYFINEMPENELEMTISEWITHSAEQGKKHLKETCTFMLEQFDQESERALQKLKQLPTE